MDVTNTSKAPQGIHTLEGVVYIQPGQTKSVRLNKTLEGHAKGLDFFELEGEAEDDDLGKADAGGGVTVSAAQLDELKAKFEEKDAEIGRLTSENTDLRRKVEDLTSEKASLDELLAASEAEIAGLKAAKQTTAAGYVVSEKSPGWYVITKEGAEVTKSLRKDDVAEFPTMSDDDKTAFVELNKAS